MGRTVVDGIADVAAAAAAVVPLIWLAADMYIACDGVAGVANIVDSIWDLVAASSNSVLLVSANGE